LLEVRNLTKAFGGVVANNSISIDVRRGAIVGLIGPNGSGKTTLFNCITGQHRLDGGTVRFEGRDLAGCSVEHNARLGLIRTFQQTHVYDGLTCLQNMQVSVSHGAERVTDMFRHHSADATELALHFLELLGLSEQCDSRAAHLSYGQRKLLEIGMALMSAPKMLLLDEPTAGINPLLIDSVVDQLRRINVELGITMLVIEHNLRVVMSLAERIYCLAGGKVLTAGTPEEIRNDPRVIDAYLGSS
jgi:branched-chain amino acid transport system ATP-binding protein